MKDPVMQSKSTCESTHAAAAPQQQAAPKVEPGLSHKPTIPSQGDIARRAYDIYVKKGSRPGHCQENWQQAEQALKLEGAATCAAHKCGCAEKAPAAASPAAKTVVSPAPPVIGVKSPAHGSPASMPQGHHGFKV